MNSDRFEDIKFNRYGTADFFDPYDRLLITGRIADGPRGNELIVRNLGTQDVFFSLSNGDSHTLQPLGTFGLKEEWRFTADWVRRE